MDRKNKHPDENDNSGDSRISEKIHLHKSIIVLKLTGVNSLQCLNTLEKHLGVKVFIRRVNVVIGQSEAG